MLEHPGEAFGTFESPPHKARGKLPRDGGQLSLHRSAELGRAPAYHSVQPSDGGIESVQDGLRLLALAVPVEPDDLAHGPTVARGCDIRIGHRLGATRPLSGARSVTTGTGRDYWSGPERSSWCMGAMGWRTIVRIAAGCAPGVR